MFILYTFLYTCIGIAAFSVTMDVLDARDEHGYSTLTRVQEWFVIGLAASWPVWFMIVLIIISTAYLARKFISK